MLQLRSSCRRGGSGPSAAGAINNGGSRQRHNPTLHRSFGDILSNASGEGGCLSAARAPVTFTALARCLLAVFTLIYSSLLHRPVPPSWHRGQPPLAMLLSGSGAGAGTALR